MTQTAGAPGRAPGAEEPEPRSSPLVPVRTGLVVAVVFVLGLLVGALTVGLLGSDPVVVGTAESPRGAGAVSGPSLPEEDAAAQFVVSGACLGAVNAAQDTLLLVDDVGRGVAELDAAALDETVRRLMPLQTRLENGLEDCRVAVEVSGGGLGEPEGSAPSPADPSETSPSTSPSSPSADD